MKTVFSKPRALVLGIAISISFQLFPMGEQPTSSSWVDTIRSYMTGKTALWAGVVAAGGLAAGVLLHRYFTQSPNTNKKKKNHDVDPSIPATKEDAAVSAILTHPAKFDMKKAADIYRIASILRKDDALRKKDELEKRAGREPLTNELRKKYENKLAQLKSGKEWYYMLADHGKLDGESVRDTLNEFLGLKCDNAEAKKEFLNIVGDLTLLRVITIHWDILLEIIGRERFYFRDLTCSEELIKNLLKRGVSLNSSHNCSYKLRMNLLHILEGSLAGKDSYSNTDSVISTPTLFVEVADLIQSECLTAIKSGRDFRYVMTKSLPDHLGEVKDLSTKINAVSNNNDSIKAIVHKIKSLPEGMISFGWSPGIEEIMIKKVKTWCDKKQNVLNRYFLYEESIDFISTDAERAEALKQREARERAQAEEFTFYYEREGNKAATRPAN